MATVSNNEFKLLCPHAAQRQSGSVVTFSCHLSPEISAVNMEIRWFKETRCVCLYKNKQVTEGRGYEHRVNLFTQELERGNVSLQLTDCTESDLGHYLCQVTDGDRTEELVLGVLMNVDTDSSQGSAYISQIDRKWTEEEKMKMEESALLTEYKSENERLNDALKEKSSKLEKTEEELRTISKSLSDKDQQLNECKKQIEDKDTELRNREKIMEKKDTLLKDRNTRLKKTTEALQERDRALQERDRALQERDQQLKLKDTQIQEARTQVEEKERRLVEKEKELKEKNEQLKVKDTQLKEKDTLVKQHLQTNEKTLSEKDAALMEMDAKLKSATEQIKEKNTQLDNINKLMSEKDTQLENTVKELEINKNQLETLGQELQDKNRELEEIMGVLEQQKTELEGKKQQLAKRERQLMERDRQLQEKDLLLAENAQALQSKDMNLEKMDTELREVNSELQKTAQKLKDNQRQLEEKERQLGTLSEKDAALMELDEKLKSATEQIKEKNIRLDNIKILMSEKDTQLENNVKELEINKNQLETLGQELQDKNRELQEIMGILEQQKTELIEKDKQLEEKQSLLLKRETQLRERDEQLQGKERDITHPDSSAPVRKRNSMEGLPPYMGGDSSTSDSPLSVPVTELRLLLLGGMGSGKSAARNTILGREKSQAATSTSTQQSESTQGEVAGRKVTVVDTPDWFSPGLSVEKLRQDVGHCVCLSAPGPHAFLLVIPIPVKQPTGEERGMLETMEEIFGEGCWETVLLLFTVSDEIQKKNIEDFIQSGDQEVQRLVEKCGNRFHCLNIKESGDGSQVSELLEKIEKMVVQNEGRFHSSEVYLDMESEIGKMIMWAKEKKIAKEEKELRVKLEQQLQNSLKKIEGMIQEHEKDITQLDSQIADLEGKIHEEMDDVKKEKLEGELEGERHKRTKIENVIMILNEKIEWERREMDERLRQKVEEIRKAYEGEAGMEAERNLMKIMLPEIQRNLLTSKSQMEEDFRGLIEEKDRELEFLKQTLAQLRDATKESISGREVQEESGEMVSSNKCRKRGGSI